jgi:hypothetical protein
MKYRDKNILFVFVFVITFQISSCLSYDNKNIPYQVNTDIIEMQYEILYIEDVAIFFPWQIFYVYSSYFSYSIFFEYYYSNYMNLNIEINPNWEDENSYSLMDKIYSFNETLGDFLMFQYNMFEFIDGITGGPERRRREEIKENRRWNILNPSQPPRLPDR